MIIIFTFRLIIKLYYICINLGATMRKKSMHVILMATVLIFSSLAGCLGTEDSEDETKATVVVSTYHVEQIVSAIAGDSLNVEILAPSNVPVHDYEPSATDLVRLQGADMFFYHGLGLETWIDATLDSLGDDAPPSFSTHAMPAGQTALDYEGMLLTELCEHLNDGPFETATLMDEEDHADDLEIHAEHVTHTLTFPGVDHDEHDHDDHGDEDGHDDEEMTPEMVLEMFDNNSDGMLSWEEFIDSWDEDEDDHDDDHDDHHDEEMVCYDMSTHSTNDAYTNQTDCEAAGLMWTENRSDDHDDHGDEEEEEMLRAIWNESDTDMDGNLSAEELEHFIHEVMELTEEDETVGYAVIHIEAEGEYGFALPVEVEMFILSNGDAHAGHGHDDHGDDHGDEDEHDDHGDEDGHDDHGDEEALEFDPHSWLDPVAYKTQVSLVLDEMKKTFPDLADTFQANADAFMASLDKLDADYDAAFGANGTCTNKSVAANHNAYSYIAYRYDIEFVTVHGLDPEGEPSAADIAKVVEKIDEDEITVLYVEEYTDVTAVNSIVEQTNGVSVQTLYTMELPPKDSSDDYLSLMEKNLDSLKTGLGC